MASKGWVSRGRVGGVGPGARDAHLYESLWVLDPHLYGSAWAMGWMDGVGRLGGMKAIWTQKGFSGIVKLLGKLHRET